MSIVSQALVSVNPPKVVCDVNNFRATLSETFPLSDSTRGSRRGRLHLAQSELDSDFASL